MGNTVQMQRGLGLADVPRPTERRAMKHAAATQSPAPTPDALFEKLLAAQRTGDQHGVSLFGHAIARIAGASR